MKKILDKLFKRSKLPQNIVMTVDTEAALSVMRKTLETQKDRIATLEMKVASLDNKPQKEPLGKFYPTQAPYQSGHIHHGTETIRDGEVMGQSPKPYPSTASQPYALSFGSDPIGSPKRDRTESGLLEM